MAVQDTVADRQAQWSKTADRLKAIIDNARWWVFLLSAAGAILAAVASQLDGGASGTAAALFSNPRAWVAIAAAVCLAFATFFTQRLLGADHITAWTRARAISERLKREAYKFAAAAAPYNDPDPAKAASALNAERIKIEADGDNLVQHLVTDAGQGRSPRTPIARDAYLKDRVHDQTTWYTDKAKTYGEYATNLRRIEFALALAATLITAIASVMGKPVLFGIQFDAAAFTAVLTTLAGAVLAHVEAQRYDYLVMTYRATARRLQDRADGPQDPWSDFVNDCENILAAENTSWIAKWTS